MALSAAARDTAMEWYAWLLNHAVTFTEEERQSSKLHRNIREF